MTPLPLASEMNIQVIARLIARGSDAPVQGAAFNVRLFDRDFLEDAYLGQSVPDAAGVVRFSFPASAIAKTALDDAMPDFFFVVYHGGEIIFKSQVMHNINMEAIQQYQHGVGEVIDLGTFLITV